MIVGTVDQNNKILPKGFTFDSYVQPCTVFDFSSLKSQDKYFQYFG